MKEIQFKKPNTLKQIKDLFFVDFVDKDEDGYWVYLKDGYRSVNMECGTIREDTVKEVIDSLMYGVLDEKSDERMDVPDEPEEIPTIQSSDKLVETPVDKPTTQKQDNTMISFNRPKDVKEINNLFFVDFVDKEKVDGEMTLYYKPFWFITLNPRYKSIDTETSTIMGETLEEAIDSLMVGIEDTQPDKSSDDPVETIPDKTVDVDLDNMSDGDQETYERYLESTNVPDDYHETIYDMLQKYRVQ